MEDFLKTVGVGIYRFQIYKFFLLFTAVDVDECKPGAGQKHIPDILSRKAG